MDFVKYGIYYAIVYFEELNKYKIRPILLLEDKDQFNMFYINKITSQNTGYKYDYPIKKWKEIGLKAPSYIKLAYEYTIDKKQIKSKIGDLQAEDIEGMTKLKAKMLEEFKSFENIYNIQLKNSIDIPQDIIDQINNKNIPKM